MAFNQVQYDLLKLMYSHVEYIVGNLYYVTNSEHLNDRFFVNNDLGGRILNIEKNTSVDVSEFCTNEVSRYKIVTFKNGKKHVAYVYDIFTEEYLGDVSYKYGGARDTENAIQLKGNKIAFVYKRLDYYGDDGGTDVIILDLMTKRMLKTGRVDIFTELEDKITFIGYNSKYANEMYTSYTFYKEP